MAAGGGGAGRAAATLRRQAQGGDAAGVAGAVGEGEGAAVVFGDRATADEADAGAFGFCGEERDEAIGRLRDAGAVVFAEYYSVTSILEIA